MTIDINKVRVQLDSDSIIDHIDLHANLKPTLTTFPDRLEAAEGERDWRADRCEDAMSECASLRAKIAAMEKQRPVAWADAFGEPFRNRCEIDGVASPLYALPGAQAQNVPKAVAYLDLGTGGYMDIGTEFTDEELATLPKGRHMLGIVGTYGVDGYVQAQPAPSVPTTLLVAVADLVAQMEIVRRVGFVDTPNDKDSCAAFCVAEGTWLELMSAVESLASALAAAPEAKP